MPSISYRFWRTVRTSALDEIASAHTAVGGTARGRRYTTQQINRAYAVLLASQFQGFCRQLHFESVGHLLGALALPSALEPFVQAEFTRGLHLDRGNAQPSSLGADFVRLGLNLWDALEVQDIASLQWKNDLDLLNSWRNAIAHQDFTSPKLDGTIYLQLHQVKRWRWSCRRLARAMDGLLGQHLQTLTGVSPW
jgi:hypothetical protein